MSFTWLVLFVVIGLSGAWWWQDHKAQQEEISTMADQSTAELNAGDSGSQSIPLDNGADNTAPDVANSAPVDTSAAPAPAPAAPAAPAATAANNNAVVAPSQAQVDTAAGAAVPASAANRSGERDRSRCGSGSGPELLCRLLAGS